MGRIRAAPPRSRQCSTMPASVSAPRACTALGTSTAQALRLGGRPGLEERLRDNALGQVVETLESLSAGDDEVTVVPEPVEHRLRRLPVPHAALARALEVPRAERAALFESFEDLLGEVRVRLTYLAVPAAPTLPFICAGEAPSSTGSRHASCAQDPNTPPRPRSRVTLQRRDSRRRARRARSDGSRSTAEIESSCTHERCRIVSSTSRVVPVRERGAYRCAVMTRRRSAVSETVGTLGRECAGRGGAEAPRPAQLRSATGCCHLDEPRAGDPGERRIALAVGLDEELHAVPVLEREVRAGIDGIRDAAVGCRRRVGGGRRQDRRRAEGTRARSAT